MLTGSADGQTNPSQCEEPSLTMRASTPNVGLAAVLAAAALFTVLLCPGPATAYDPATDQYTPSTPSGAGSVPTQGGDDSDSGGAGVGGGSDSGTGGDSTPAPAPGTVPVAPPGSGPADADAGSAPGARDEATLRDFAFTAGRQRDALADVDAGVRSERR